MKKGADTVSEGPDDKATVYQLDAGKTIGGMKDAINLFLNTQENLLTQTIDLADGNYMIQARADGGEWKQWVGADRALTITLKHAGDDGVEVSFQQAKWADKAGVMTFSMFVFWPLAITSGVGIYKQWKLPADIKQAVEAYLEA